MFPTIFNFSQSKYDVIDVIVTSLWIKILLPLNFVSENSHAKFGCNWTTNKEETEVGGGAQCPYINKIPQPKSLGFSFFQDLVSFASFEIRNLTP